MQSVYGVPEGKEEAGRTEWKIEVIFPVSWEITMVAAVRRSPITAREEAKTVMSDPWEGSSRWSTGETGRRPSSIEWGVVVPVAKGAIMGLEA